MSKDTKLFSIAGTSTYRGVNTWRFSNGSLASRVKVLARGEHVDINLMVLPQPMTKVQAVAYLTDKEKMAAAMPKTGRGSGVKPEDVAAHVAHVESKAAAVTAKLEEVAAADAEFFAKLGDE